MNDYSLDSPSNQLKSQQSEESVIDFVCTVLPEEPQEEIRPNSNSPQHQNKSCFKRIEQFDNQESSSDQNYLRQENYPTQFPFCDIMGHHIPSPFNGRESDGSDEGQIDDEKENLSSKKMYLMTPMKLGSLNRSPLQDITPSIRKKEKPHTSMFTYQKSSISHQTPRTMAGSRTKFDSSSRRLKTFRI